jgi:hypothetical protein
LGLCRSGAKLSGQPAKIIPSLSREVLTSAMFSIRLRIRLDTSECATYNACFITHAGAAPGVIRQSDSHSILEVV